MSRITDELAALEGRSRLSFHPNYVCGTQSKNISEELETHCIKLCLTHRPDAKHHRARNNELRSSTKNRPWKWRNEQILFQNWKRSSSIGEASKSPFLDESKVKTFWKERCPNLLLKWATRKERTVGILKRVVRDRDLVREESQHFRDKYKHSEGLAHFRTT